MNVITDDQARQFLEKIDKKGDDIGDVPDTLGIYRDGGKFSWFRFIDNEFDAGEENSFSEAYKSAKRQIGK